jgi:alkanesulfonate monooxygenase SsuD/methylene tetrahydromethanopterin reductase-like flavin-dependent oxidoreductase (luciferase family)
LDELERQLSEITRQLSGAETVRPTPVQRRLPIIVGGKGGRRTITAAIEFADEYNLAEPTLDRASAIRTALDRAAAERGRSPLRLSVMGGCVVGSDSADVAYRTAQRRGVTKSDARPEFSGTVEEVVAALRCYEQIGVDRVMLSHLVHEDVEMVHLLRSVADALH